MFSEMLNTMPILSLTIFLLLAGGVLIALTPNPRSVRWIALFVALLELGLSLVVLLRFDTQKQGFQLLLHLAFRITA